MSDLVKPESTSIVPASTCAGLEGIASAELNVRPPQIKIVQAQRGEDIAGNRNLFEGDIYDSASLEKIGDEDKGPSLVFAAFWHQFIEWEGKGEDAKVLRSTNSAVADWVVGRTRPTKKADGTWEKPAVSKYIRALAIKPGSNFPRIVTFKATSLTCAEQIILATQDRGGALWDRVWELRTKSKPTKEGGAYYIFTASPIGNADDATKALAQQFNAQFAYLRSEAVAED